MHTGNRLLARGAFAVTALATAVAAQATTAPERLFLQQLSPHSVIVKWRGGNADRVCFSTRLTDLSKPNWPRCVAASMEDNVLGHKVAQLTGLAPDQTYYYSLGSIANEAQQFRTPQNSNKPPRDGNTHILIVGDSGTQTERLPLPFGGAYTHRGEAALVLAGFNTYNAANGNEPVDLFLALGDNAYNAGTDPEWQGSFFEIYPEVLKSAMVLPTIGNHEMGYGQIDYKLVAPSLPAGFIQLEGSSVSADPASYDGDRLFAVPAEGYGPPYLDIFSLPANGESGGVPSGTEQYYSIDYGNVHIVSLDSQLSMRDATQQEEMKNWLIDDLSANTRDWTVVIFHHPPYTKGANHDSDDTEFGDPVLGNGDRPEWDMRNSFTPIFEQYGVDVVYSGHSHSYERSYYLRGHTGKSNTFDPALHAELNANNQPSLGNGDDTYAQLSPGSGGMDDRVVYTVAGNSGKADSRGGFTTSDAEWLRHPAHIPQAADGACGTPAGCRRGLARNSSNQPIRGSVVLDASGHSLTAKFVDTNGSVLDNFTITR